MEFDINFWENMTYLLGGIVFAGVCAALAQIISIRMLTSQTKINIAFKKEDSDGSGTPTSSNHR